jgi:hypothetical protein
MRYMMMMIARDVIDLLRHTSSTCIFRFLVFVLVYMVDTYLSSIDIYYDVLLEEYLLDILMHAFDM